MGLLGFVGAVGLGTMRGPPIPAIHDEFSYLLGADTFAQGRLTNPTHPHWEHFESFHILQTPTYQSKYPPAQSGLLAAGQVLLGDPAWGVWMGAGLLAASLTWALLKWLPAHWGMLAAMLGTLHLCWGSYWAQSYWGGAVAAIGGALAVGAVRLIHTREPVLGGVLFGAGLGIMALSRPYEGAILGLGLTTLVVIGAARRRAAVPFFKSLALSGVAAGVVLSGALTFQAVYNRAVTGSITTMPYQADSRQYAAAPVFLFQSLPPMPAYNHEEMRRFWAEWGRERYIESHSPRALLRRISSELLALGVFFLGPGLAALGGLLWAAGGSSRRGIQALTVLMIMGSIVTLAAYPHYLAPATVLFFILWGWGLQGFHRRGRWRGKLNFAMPVATATFILFSITTLSFLFTEPSDFALARSELLERLTAMPGQHLVLVQYDPQHNYHSEWVYNEADVDAAKVVWARSMGPARDHDLLSYFSGRIIWDAEVSGASYRIEARNGE